MTTTDTTLTAVARDAEARAPLHRPAGAARPRKPLRGRTDANPSADSEETTMPFEYSPTLAVTRTDNPNTTELRMFGAAFLATLSALDRTEIETKRRAGLLRNLNTLIEIVALNCSLPISATTLVLMCALPKTRAEFPKLIAEHGDLLENPAPFADLYADNVVELEAITQRLKASAAA